MECEVCGMKTQVLWRIARWSDGGHTKDVCPVCGLRMLGMEEGVSSQEEKRLRITREIRENKPASVA